MRERRVIDAGGDPVGRLRDVAVLPQEQIPVVRWAVLGTREGERVVRWRDVAIEPAHVRLRRRLAFMAPESLPAEALRLGRDLLDRSARDTRAGTAIRVNDVQLEEAAGLLRLIGADVSARGLLRRVGLESVATVLLRAVGRRIVPRIVPWSAVDLGGRGPA